MGGITGKCNLRINEFRLPGPTADGTDVLEGVCGHVIVSMECARVRERSLALACNNRDGNITRQKGVLSQRDQEMRSDARLTVSHSRLREFSCEW